ncbi:MAG: protein kinase domain-containing protein [Gemmatimonadota bacterium]|jgi:serine/threonine-protein kinase
MSADQPEQPATPAPAATAPAEPGGLPVTDRDEFEALRSATLGQYDVAGELGRGGMATVYLAHDIALDRKVAVKVMSQVLSLGDGVERFKREAKTAASLSHPNIIPIYAVQHTERLLYFVMKYVDGRSLDSIIRELGPLPIPMIQAILGQAASAFGYAHRRGVVHRDIKPGNILIDDEGWAVITDFGIAKVAEAEQLTSTGLSVGTPTYMSPEQVGALPVTGASDQYSLGVVAYEMLTGKPPFTGGGMMAMMYAHVHQAPAPIENVRPDCPEGLRAAVMRMLAKDPAERWPSVEDVIAAIGSPTLTPDDPTRSQLIAIAKTGQRRAIGVTTPKSPIPLMRTPIPLSSTPRTGAVATGAGAAAGAESGVAAGPVTGPVEDAAATGADTAAAPGAVPVVVRRHSAPLSLALAGGGLLIAIAAIAVAIRSRSTGRAAPAQDTGVVPEAAAAVPAAPPAAPAPVEPQQSALKGPPAPKAAAPRKSPGGKPAPAAKEKSPVAAPESAVASAPAPVPANTEPSAESANPAPATPVGPSVAARGVSGGAALLGLPGAQSGVQTGGPAAADRKGVEAAIRGYAAALDGGSAARAQRAFPAMPSAQQTYLESFFGAGGRMRTDWKVADVSVQGDRATARVRGTTRTTPGGGNPSLEQVDTRVTLERAADGWTLKSFGGPGGH